jgi:hypothetical protein
MRIKYTFADQPQEFEIPDSDDLSELCTTTEKKLCEIHPELGDRSYLTERVADALLNSLSSEGDEVDLRDLS